ncbi:MAG: TonB family protein [Rudaea sp.]
MTALSVRNASVDPFNLPRVGAWSGSISLHLALVLLLLGSPVALHWVRQAPAEQTITVILPADPKPVAPIPALPKPLTKAKTRPQLTHAVTPQPASPEAAIAPVTATLSIPGPTVVSVASNEVAAASDTPPTALAYGNRTQVAYPLSALRRREEGTVILHVLVSAYGLASIVEIERSSGSTDLDNAARAAVKLWHFQPATHAGLAQQAWAVVPITFRLSTL